LTAEGVPLQTVTPMITNGEARHVSNSATVASSPPQKRRRINAPKIERQPHAELLLPETRQLQKDRRQECAQRIVDWCVRHSEWANVKRAPLVSDELLSIVINEVKRKHRPKARNATAHPEKGKMPIVELNAFECSDELDWIRDRLRQVVEDMVERFTVYVHGAIANAPSLQPTSSGRFAYRKQLDEDVNMACRHLFESYNDPLVFQCRTMQTLQFPELRLIEYDCGKLQVLSALLRDLFIYKHRCLIFTQMSRMLDVLQAFLSFHGYQYFRLDGTTGIEQRQAMMERFNSDPKIFCFILSTRSGGIGVNLTGADTVIFYDSDWNPTMDAQAQDRCHRVRADYWLSAIYALNALPQIGQTRNVTIYRLISERTIEENILKKAMQKRRLGELAIDEAGFTPEFFKGDNLRELFQGEAAVADVVAPVSVNDPAELEKVMARLEDVQDVAAANRANAEAKAELAEFDENVQPKEDNVSNSNALDGTDSKYFELLNQLKPIERYAINFLEAEYKPDFEEEVKEAEAMIASKKDEWLKAHETVLEGGDGDELNDDDDEFDVTYANGFKIPGSIDEVRNKRGAKSTNIHASSSASNISSKVSPPQAHKQRLIPSRFSSRISAASALSSKNNTTVSQSNTKNSTNSTTTASRALRLTRRHSSDSNLKASQTSKRVSSTTSTTKSSSNDKNKSKKKVITDRTSSTTAANKRNVKSTGIDGNKSKSSKQQRSTKGRSANDKAHKGTTADVTTKVDSRGAEQKLVMKKKNKNDLSIRNEGNVLVVDSDDEHFSLPSSSNESEPQAASSSRKSRGKPTHYVSTLSDQRPLMSSSPSPLPSYPMHPTTYAVRSDRQLNTSSDDVRASTSAITPQTFSCVLVPLSPTSVISSSSTTTASPRSMTTSQSSGRSQIVGTTRGINVQPSTSQKSFSSEDIRDRYVMTTSSSTINNRQRLITSGRSLPSTSYRLVATSQSTSGVRQHISSGATAAGSTIPVQRRLVVVSRSSSSQPVSVINAQQASTSSCRPSSNIRVISTASGSSSYRVLSAARSSASPSLLYQRQQPSYFVTSGTGSDGVVSDGRRARLPSISSQGGGYTKPSLGDYERPRLFFRKRASVPQQQAQSSSEADDRASSSGNVVHMSATDSDHNATNDVDVNANTETGAS
uniref:Helicase domino (inferred by orthology to a D. melanogaster protein) n=1 Tax=Anisakis simplex TaxID=6269 RepID=A0A0M3K995_ANISI